MRKVECLKFNTKTYCYDTSVTGYFHQWGLELDEGDSEERFNNYTVAVVELEDGTIETFMPDKVKFM